MVAIDFFMNSRRALESADVSPAAAGWPIRRNQRYSQRTTYRMFLTLFRREIPCRCCDALGACRLHARPTRRRQIHSMVSNAIKSAKQRPHAPGRCLLDLGRPDNPRQALDQRRQILASLSRPCRRTARRSGAAGRGRAVGSAARTGRRGSGPRATCYRPGCCFRRRSTRSATLASGSTPGGSDFDSAIGSIAP